VSESVVGAVRAAVWGAADGGWKGMAGLCDALGRVDRARDPRATGLALEVVGARPELVVRLDLDVRHGPGVPEPEGLAGAVLAASDRDGRVRERAVAMLSQQMRPEVLPFLVLRTTDWVVQVRNRARAALAVALGENPVRMLPAALPMTLLLRGRERGAFAVAQATAALTMVDPGSRWWLTTSGVARQRRFVLDVGLTQGWYRQEELVRIAETEPEPRNRVPAAEAVCREAVWTRRPAVLRRLAGNRSGVIRALALTGLVRGGLDTEAAAHLDERSPLVRAIAREAARRVGIDPLAHYRTACAGADPAAGAVAGLAEVGSAVDAPLLTALLAHQGHRVRLAAVKGLRALDCVVVDELLPLLEDGSPTVVRAAVGALLPVAEQVPQAPAWRLLDDERTVRREAGYRLLAARGADTLLRAALLVAGSARAADGRDRVVRRAVADLTRLARDWHGRWGLPRRPAPTDGTELLGLAGRAQSTLGPDTTRMLTDWLGTPTGRTRA
jgi:hypothetical protein